MTLRTRLLIGYATLVLLLMLAAGGGAIGFRQMSVAARTRLEHFVRATDLEQSLLHEMEGHRDALLSWLLDPSGPGRREALGDAEGRVRAAISCFVGDQDHDLAEALSAVDAYLAVTTEFLASGEAPTVARYHSDVAPSFARARDVAARRIAVDRASLADTTHEVAATARGNTALLGALAMVGLLTLAGFARGLKTRVLDRLEAVEAFAASIEEGRTDQRLTLGGRDELARLGRGMNRMLDKRQELEGNLRGRLAQERQLLLGLLAHAGPGAMLLGRSGERVGAAPPEAPDAVSDALRDAIRAARSDAEIEAFTAVPWTAPDATTWRVTALHHANRVSGWVAVPAAAEV